MMDTPLQERTEAIFCELEGRTTSRRSRPSAPRASRSAAAATPRRWPQMVVWLATEAPDYMTAARLNVTGGLDKD